MKAHQVRLLSEKRAKLQDHQLITAAIMNRNMHFALAEKPKTPSVIPHACKQGALRLTQPRPGLHFTPGLHWELLQSGRRSSANTSQARQHAKRVSGAALVCSLTVHSRVHYICGSNRRSGPGLRQIHRRGCASASTSTSLCGSVCQTATDPQIIITIKHCFPNKMISLPLILCQSLFLFASGHSIPETALTQGENKNKARLKIPPVFC